MNDIVFNILQSMLDNSPEASYKRLNPALRGTLGECISADLPFQRDTFQNIYNKLRGQWWFGDGAGSAMGEHFYTHAIHCNHASAIQSFEQFAERPGVLWEEDANIPRRLHVGVQFTWQRHVTVTSMRSDSLVVCTYQDNPNYREGLKVGAKLGYESVITSVKRDGKATILRVIKAEKDTGSRIVSKRFTIPYAAIAELRKTEKARVKKIVKIIEACDPEKDGKELSHRIAGEHFRHFQLEIINAAFAKRKALVEEQMTDEQKAEARQKGFQKRLDAWRNNVNGAWLDTDEIYLRVKDDLVDCSNGNSVSAASVRRALPIILDRRKKETGPMNLPLDGHIISRIDANGVTIGCTRVPWPEIERVNELLKITKAIAT